MFSYDLPDLSFTSPHCQTFSKHAPLPVISEISPNARVIDIKIPFHDKEIGFWDFAKPINGTHLCMTQCPQCGAYCLLEYGELVWPKPIGIPASEHMPEAVKKPYSEAQKVLHDSPWAACILLRIALERLCDYLGGTGANLFKRIESLCLNASEQAIWDAIRKAGNAAAHENADRLFEYRDNMKPNIAITLSKLINLIVESHVASRVEAQEILKMLESN